LAIDDEIKAVEDELQRTAYNKKSSHHIGKLKAKLARLRDEREKRKANASGGGGWERAAVKKSGHATVAIVGFPSVGKSTLLNKITDADSETGAYDFTTLSIIPGMMQFKGAIIQILDLPGLIEGASKGKGRGREVLSAARSADLVLLMLDVFETNLPVLLNELYTAGLRLNRKPPEIVVYKKERGGITVNYTVRGKNIDELLVKDILREWGYVNCDIVIRDSITEDDLIDHLRGNILYVPAIASINKIDMVNKEFIDSLKKRMTDLHPVFISAEKNINLDALKDAMYDALDFIRIYLRPPGERADMDEPLVIRNGSTVETICNNLHKDFRRKFRWANIWGKSVKFSGQRVGTEHRVCDGDIVTITLRR
jgi:ribosome-interacting GTPase 1